MASFLYQCSSGLDGVCVLFAGGMGGAGGAPQGSHVIYFIETTHGDDTWQVTRRYVQQLSCVPDNRHKMSHGL